MRFVNSAVLEEYYERESGQDISANSPHSKCNDNIKCTT